MINFTALIDHNLPKERLHSLPALLNSRWHEINHFLPVFDGDPVDGGVWCWGHTGLETLSQALENAERIPLEAPDFIGCVGKYSLSLCHSTRWRTFVEEDEFRRKLRGICTHIARVLGSNRIVYVPDSGSNLESGAYWMVRESKSIVEIMELLSTHCGPPAASIEAIKDNPKYHISGAGYYVDEL